jgi:predicted alpha/beta-fold hydrolase
MPIVPSGFRPAPWLPSRHLQTLWPSLVRPRPGLALRRERLELPDGDFLDLAWTRDGERPIVLVLHGLQGGLRSHYSASLVRSLERSGFQVCFMHFRGCSGEPNRLPRGYHSGETGDARHVIDAIRQRPSRQPLFAVGVSLGGNVLLKYLGEVGSQTPLAAAVAVSVPFDLANASQTLQRGLARIYQHHLLRSCVRATAAKFARIAPPFPLPNLRRLASLYEFDEAITAPLHGFASAADYYARSSSRAFLRSIRIPTLIIHARDDPFMTPDAVPMAAELSGAVTLELSAHGGHVGFIAQGDGLRVRYWLDERIPAFLARHGIERREVAA